MPIPLMVGISLDQLISLICPYFKKSFLGNLLPMELCPQGEIVPAPYVQSRLLTRAMCEVNEDDVISSPGDGNILNKLRKLSL